MYPYAPGNINPLISVVSAEGFAIAVDAGFEERADQVPLPKAAVLVVLYWQIVWSGPAEFIGMTNTFIESLQPL